MSAYYNEIDPFAAGWLRELIKAGLVAEGDVDERSIEDVEPRELANYTQCHFFAGIGVWSYALQRAGWPDDRDISDALQGLLMRLAAQYLAQTKKREGDLRTLDPVAHFHLSNGARIQRLNWKGDLSEKGLSQSAGIMVNYLYKLSHVEANHEAYTSSGKVAASSSVRSLL